MSPVLLADQYARSARLLDINLEGLTHEQSLWQPSPEVNSINWLLGHLVHVRCSIAQLLNIVPVWDGETRARYKGGTGRIDGEGAGVLTFERLAADFKAAHAQIDAALRARSLDSLEAPSPSQRFKSLADHLAYLQFHETHHIGQIMTLRELLGLPSTWPF